MYQSRIFHFQPLQFALKQKPPKTKLIWAQSLSKTEVTSPILRASSKNASFCCCCCCFQFKWNQIFNVNYLINSIISAQKNEIANIGTFMWQFSRFIWIWWQFYKQFHFRCDRWHFTIIWWHVYRMQLATKKYETNHNVCTGYDRERSLLLIQFVEFTWILYKRVRNSLNNSVHRVMSKIVVSELHLKWWMSPAIQMCQAGVWRVDIKMTWALSCIRGEFLIQVNGLA